MPERGSPPGGPDRLRPARAFRRSPMSTTTRRAFVQQSAALGLGLTASLSGKAFAANEKISVACIGVRGRGNSVMHSFADEPDCEVTHICDVNKVVRDQRGAEMKEKTGRMP